MDSDKYCWTETSIWLIYGQWSGLRGTKKVGYINQVFNKYRNNEVLPRLPQIKSIIELLDVEDHINKCINNIQRLYGIDADKTIQKLSDLKRKAKNASLNTPEFCTEANKLVRDLTNSVYKKAIK